MTKYEWEKRLKREISRLPRAEQRRVFDYYDELFADKIELNMREEEIIAEFGNPYDIASRLIVDYYNEAPRSDDEYAFSDTDKQRFEDFDRRRRNHDDDFDRRDRRAGDNDFARGQNSRGNSYSYSYSYDGSKATNTKSYDPIAVKQKIKKADGVIWALAVVLFFAMGIAGLWHPGWIVFLGAIVVCSVFEAMFKKNAKHFNYPVLVTILFLLAGFYARMWHPMWMLFVTIPVFYTICGTFGKGQGNSKSSESDQQPREQRQPREQEDFREPPLRHTPRPEYDTRPSNPSPKTGTSAGRVIGAILLAGLFIYISIVAWSTVIGLFAGGLGMIAGGVAIVAVSVGQFVSSYAMAMALMGAGLLVLGLGLVFAVGTVALFKVLVKMCKAMATAVKRVYNGQAVV